MRILPVIHLGINEEWITNKTRFSYDGYIIQRIVFCLVQKDNNLIKTLHINILKQLVIRLDDYIHFFLTDDLSVETVYGIKILKNLLNNSEIILKNKLQLRNIDFRQNYLLNTTYSSINKSDCCFIIGCNLKKEMPLILMRLRREKREREIKIVVLGCNTKYNLEEIFIGLNTNVFLNIIEGKHMECVSLKKAKKPIIFIGNGLLTNGSMFNFTNLFKYIKNLNTKTWQGLNYIEIGVGNFNSYEIGLNSQNLKRNISKIINIGNLDINYNVEKKFNLYIGSFGENILNTCTMVLPAKTSIESTSLYINNEGRCQTTKQIQIGPKQAKVS